MRYAIKLIEDLLYSKQDEPLENWMLLDIAVKAACEGKNEPSFECPSHDGAKRGASCVGEKVCDPWHDVAKRLNDWKLIYICKNGGMYVTERGYHLWCALKHLAEIDPEDNQKEVERNA